MKSEKLLLTLPNKTVNPKKLSSKSGFLALSPLLVFLTFYLVFSLLAHDFYSVPITVAFMLASAYSVFLLRGMKLDERIKVYSKGAAHSNLLMMIWIFILAGAFAHSAKQMGAIQATVDLCLWTLPPQFLLAGLFLAACFISLSVGTSVGTIVALVPIATGIAASIDNPQLSTFNSQLSTPFVVAVVVGGAYFGDNLSFISDTTIVATQTQGCRMSDKFKLNARIVVPAALMVLLLYVMMGCNLQISNAVSHIDWLLVVPYLLVLGSALMGMNVMMVLVLGILSTGVIGILRGSYRFYEWLTAMGEGILGMGELIIVTLMAAGMVGVIRQLGGIDFILQRLTKRISGKRGAELSIAGLVVFTNFCTANNTIAILTVGNLAKEISAKFGIDPRRTASILDTFSCFAQGIIPYGAQMLMASSLALLNPIEIIPYLYYPFVMGLFMLLAILFRYPRKYAVNT
ncbi:MAG: Na+/H+ antiporter NhaC family protein [Bacteroidaceae bacterium]|nr:Na+/H+ antiporter NhaC family protein [Bacteroidaceae bacterium]